MVVDFIETSPPVIIQAENTEMIQRYEILAVHKCNKLGWDINVYGLYQSDSCLLKKLKCKWEDTAHILELFPCLMLSRH